MKDIFDFNGNGELDLVDFLIASELDPNNPLNAFERDDDEIDYDEGEYWLEHDNGSTADIFDMDANDFENWYDDLDD